jgi:hypothetical protein
MCLEADENFVGGKKLSFNYQILNPGHPNRNLVTIPTPKATETGYNEEKMLIFS